MVVAIILDDDWNDDDNDDSKDVMIVTLGIEIALVMVEMMIYTGIKAQVFNSLYRHQLCPAFLMMMMMMMMMMTMMMTMMMMITPFFVMYAANC